MQITLQGLRRIVVDEMEQTDPYPIAAIRAAREIPPDPAELDDLVARVVSAAETLAELVDRIPDEVPAILKMNVSDPGRFADLAATNMNFRIADKDEVLQRLDVGQRIRFILTRLEREVARARVMEDVKRQTEIKIEQHQREFYLRQQLRAIQAELGEADPGEKEAIDLLKKIEEAKLPDKVAQEARRETDRMRMLSPASSEYQVVRTYLDWVLSLPWNKKSGEEEIDLKKVEAALDDRHYGLDEAKERIIEYLAVRKLRGGDPHGPILCFVGPPGTGKTSLGEAIGKAIGREFYRISVGGVRDEAEIRGHRRTYVGAMPGLIIQALRRVSVKDPVLMIDEIDKMSGGGPSGDPTAAMLEVLDPSQNNSFVDHYLNLPFDLSTCLFICTANNLFDIPAPLRDRMEVIKIAGYTIEEKVEIAWRYLLAATARGARHHRQGSAVHRRVAVVHLESLFARGGPSQLRAQPRGDHAQARAQEGRGRRGRVGDRRREGRRSARHSALRRRGSGEGAGSRRRHGPRVDVDGRRHHGDRSAQDAGHRPPDGDRPARRRDARVGRRGALVRAVARQAARHSRHARSARTICTCTCRRARFRRMGRAPASRSRWRSPAC